MIPMTTAVPFSALPDPVTNAGIARTFTTGSMATELGISFGKAAYLVKTRDIRPVSRVGLGVRVYDMAALEALRAEVEKLAGRKRGRAPQADAVAV